MAFDYPSARIEVDTHTHTVLSGHAWSTLMENARYAAETGLKGLCTTEHAHCIVGTAPPLLPGTFHMLPPELFGVQLFMGLEFNILDYEGNIDPYASKHFNQIRFGIASMHRDVIEPGTANQHTEAYLAALEHPLVDVLGHPGTVAYPCDIPAVVAAAKAQSKIIEINNNSFLARPGGRGNCLAYARECMRQDVRVCVSSDAHFAHSVGVVNLSMELLAEVDFPPELILNLRMDGFLAYLQQERARRIDGYKT